MSWNIEKLDIIDRTPTQFVQVVLRASPVDKRGIEEHSRVVVDELVLTSRQESLAPEGADNACSLHGLRKKAEDWRHRQGEEAPHLAGRRHVHQLKEIKSAL